MAVGSKTLYFAYGSNLSLTQMASRCPTSAYVAPARLKGWKWIIGERGYANVVPSPKSSAALATLKGKAVPPSDEGPTEDYVMGMLYSLEEEDETKLDRAEGVPHAYVKEMLQVDVLDEEEREASVRALVYVDVARLGEGNCKEEYVGRMNRGIKDLIRLAKVGDAEGYVRRYLRPFVRDENIPDEVGDPFHPDKEIYV